MINIISTNMFHLNYSLTFVLYFLKTAYLRNYYRIRNLTTSQRYFNIKKETLSKRLK